MTISRFLEPSAVAAVERLRFAPRRRLEGNFTGRHSSRRLGGAGEFADYREYSGGEDLRRLDWKVLARTGKAFTRQYQDENNLVCTLVIDASGSMDFGAPRTKLDHARCIAAALAYLIGRQQDQVGLAVIAKGIDAYLAPSGSPIHLAGLFEMIDAVATQPVTKLGDALQELYRRGRGRGVLVLLSDFLVDEPDAAFAALRLFRHRGWEVIVAHVVHPDEEQLPEATALRFVGLENDGVVNATPADIRDDYRRRFAAHENVVRSLALAAGCDYVRASTAVPYLQTLGRFLVERTG